MSRRPRPPTAPVGQQGPPARAAASAVRTLRSARGSLLLTTGTAYAVLDLDHEHSDQQMHLTAPSRRSRSIGTGGRDPSEQVVTIVGMRTPQLSEENMASISIAKS
jgi:hypothetical protein